MLVSPSSVDQGLKNKKNILIQPHGNVNDTRFKDLGFLPLPCAILTCACLKKRLKRVRNKKRFWDSAPRFTPTEGQ